MTATAAPPPFAPDTEPMTGPLIDVCANLLPNEIVAGRRLAALKQRLAFGLAALLAVLLLIYAFSWFQTHQARSHLAAQRHRGASMQETMRGFGPLLTAQTESARIQKTLTGLMAQDVQWRDVLAKVRAAATGVVSVSGVNASITGAGGNAPAAPSAAGLPVLNQTGAQAVGTLAISGTANDKNAIASFVDKLGSIKGLTAAFPANFTGTAGKLTFSVDVLITSDALGGRYAATQKTPVTQTQGGH